MNFPMVRSGTPPDPFVLTDYKVHVGYTTTTGRTAESAAIGSGEKTLVAIVAGQSLAGNHGVSLYNPTNAALVQNLNIPNNTLYRLVDPVLGASGTDGSFIGRLGDKLIDGLSYERVIFIPIAIGATSVQEWKPSGFYNHRLIAAALRAKALGWLDANADITPCVLWQQGEANGTDGTTQAQYEAWFVELQTTLLGRGIDIPWLLAKSTMVTNTVSSTIRAAIDALVSPAANRYAGPDVDSLTGGTNRQAEGTHLSDTGNDACAALWKTAIDAAFA